MLYSLDNSPGVITSNHQISESVVYSSSGTNQTFTINLSTVPVSQYRNYGLVISGSLITYVYPGIGGIDDLTSAYANFLNTFGYFWATVIPGNTIRLTARTIGTDYSLNKGLNLDNATITQTVSGQIPQPLTPGTILFYDIRKDTVVQQINDHKFVTTFDQVSGVSGFNSLRHCAGIVISESSNDGFAASISGSDLRVLRQGIITYRNYGSLINRLTPVTFNPAAPTALLPGGSIGGGLLNNSLASILFPMSYCTPGQIGEMRISLP